MKRLLGFGAPISIALLLLSGAPVHAQEAKVGVEEGNRAFIAFFLAGDAQGIAQLYTADAEVIPPGAPVVRGRAAIGPFWKSFIDSTKDVDLKTKNVESAGDLAYETGVARVISKQDHTSEVRYVVVWKRENGRWKLHRDIWNSGGGK